MGEVIRLGSAASDVIKLGSKTAKKEWASITEQLQKQKKFKGVKKFITSPKTTFGLTATLLGLLNPAAAVGLVKGAAAKVGSKLALHPLKYAAGGLVATGILAESKKAREWVKKTPERLLGYGTALGGMIEDPDKVKKAAKEKGWWPTTKAGLKKAGIYGGIAAAGLGAAALGKKYLESRKEKKAKVGLIEKDQPVPTQPAYLSPAFAGYPPAISPMQPAAALKGAPAIHNIIQIQIPR